MNTTIIIKSRSIWTTRKSILKLWNRTSLLIIDYSLFDNAKISRYVVVVFFRDNFFQQQAQKSTFSRTISSNWTVEIRSLCNYDLFFQLIFLYKEIVLLLFFFFLSLFFLSLFFQVCERRLKGIIYQLVVKGHNVLDLAHQKECAIWCCWI